MKRLVFLFFVLNMLFINSTLAQNKKNERCKEIKVCSDTVMFASDYNKLKEKNRQLGECVNDQKLTISGLENLLKNGIESFLKISDVSIFKENFREYNTNELPVCVQDYYSLIKNIHLLYKQMTDIEKLNLYQIDQLNEGLEKALTTINVVNSFATIERHKVSDYLSEEQKQFYRDLVYKYNELVLRYGQK